MINDYTLKLFNRFGQFKTTLDLPLDFEFGRQKNEVGNASFLLPATLYSPSLFEQDDRIEIWKYDNLTQTDTLQADALWFLQKLELRDKEKTIELIFTDQNILFKRRYVTWYKVEGVGYPSHFNDYTSNILNRIIYHNMGAGVSNNMSFGAAGVPSAITTLGTSKRIMPIIQNEGLVSNLGPALNIEFSWKEVLEALNIVAKAATIESGELVWFDLIYKPINFNSNVIGNMYFKTWIGSRGTQENITISPENVLNNGILTKDYTDIATVIYAIGTEDPPVDDDVENVQIQPYPTSYTQSNSFYEIEFVVSESGEAITPDTLASLAKATAFDKRPKSNIQGEIIQIPGLEFGRDYFYGDELKVDFYDEQFTAIISKFVVSVSKDEEKITIPLETIDDLINSN
jgi:hypothetical protein